jgi:hypothetical protein
MGDSLERLSAFPNEVKLIEARFKAAKRLEEDNV